MACVKLPLFFNSTKIRSVLNMVVRYHAEGYDSFCKLITELEGKKVNSFILFAGAADSKGVSWCPDCVVAEPVIEKVLASLNETIHFVHVSVGERPDWKDPNNKFRKDDRLHLKVIPTLLHWGGPERLEKADCAKQDLVQLIFEDN